MAPMAKKGIDFEDIDRARRCLGLGEEATLEEIKAAYRELARRYHPDKGKSSEEMMREINWAYEVLMNYISYYRYSFRREDVARHDPDRVLKRFFEDWMWGKGL